MTWLRSCPVYSFFSLFSLSMYVYVYVALTRVHEDVFVHMLERMHTLLTLSSILYERRRCICPPPLSSSDTRRVHSSSFSVCERKRESRNVQDMAVSPPSPRLPVHFP